ncbi:hypothetical protein SLEP1_g43710 [Rubroshorea leprosula]|uniref:RNase H type-1 domain-containing protein n=1 Tax=Rubroshorea leprosula TaxID=152421 RepID=A0AAV5LE97_9ROSI|nr:hypothetical protein SLEP1_g43710 [Rubroshorea leprosula]
MHLWDLLTSARRLSRLEFGRSVRASNSSLPLGQSQPPNNLPPLIPPQLPPQPPPQVPARFSLVDHAKGGDENQPHNSAHNLASTANQDVVAAQLAAMQQQFGVFRLVLAQLLARNNPDSLKKLVAEQRGAPPPHHVADSIPHPLNTNITLEPYHAGFKIPQLETYDGMKDPNDHLHAFYSYMQAQNAFNALMCKIFPSTLRGNARTWYYSLPPRSISSYTEMASAFATKFSNRRLIRKTTSELMRVRQRDRESLKNFMSRFNDAVLEVSSFDQAVGITVVISRLSHERFRDSLLKHPATTFSEVHDKSLKFITVEEYALLQKPTLSKNQHPEWRNDNPSRKRMRMVQNRGPMPTSTPRFGAPNFTPPRSSSENKGHSLKESAIPQIGKAWDIKVKHQNRAQKRKFNDANWKSQPVTFTSADFDTVVTPHNDPLVTSVMINNCEVQRVLVDIGSAPDIMYFHCFEGLGLDPALLQKYDGPIYGFNNQPAPVEVKMASSFNVVIGRPTLIEIRAVVSQSHLCMKFPTPIGIVTLRDNRPKDETKAAPVEDVEEVHIDDRDPSQKMQIGTKLNPGEKAELIAFLRANKDVFAWISADMPRIPTLVSQHKLSTNPLKKPVAQKWRLFGGERLQVIKEEVEKLLQAGFVRRVDYCEWVTNPVLVKKQTINGGSSGNERLSLLDAYSGYHQVPMVLEDADKTSFYADDKIYCYVMMPFSLKNAVVKSLKVGDHLTDPKETFNNLRKNRMRLNPTKCIFEVKSRKFLCFMVSRRGIEVNPEKIKVVAEMEPPNSVKDVQRLTGRVAALHRFISKSIDKCLPFFKIMRLAAQKDESGKQKKFAWNSECQAAFDELKSYLSSPPLLTKANDGEILYLYLGISDEAISSVLVKEEGKQQKLVYYISSVLRGAERSAIQAQALADFIVECTPGHSTPNPEPNNWTLYLDGASSSKGSRVGALLIGPDGYRGEHALKFNFVATNNMAEYEALLLGLQLALELKINSIQVYSDSQLVVNQTNSICEVIDPVMVKYVALVAELKCKFQKFYLNGIVPADKQEAMKLRKKASRYALIIGVLYKRSLSLPLLWCLNPYEAEYALREVREGVCGSHVGARTLAHKVLRQGYYWPNMYKDATHFVQRCPKCQFFAHLTHQPAKDLTNLVAPWPFAQWGLDLLGPFVKGVGGVTHLIIGVDYFTKWVEARPLSSLTSKKFTSVYHPESNGMVESVNKCILEGIKPRLEQHKAKWADELNNIFWAYRTTSRTATGETPYHLAFVKEEARLRTLVYKQKLANFYNKRVHPQTFKVGDLVLRKDGLTGFETRFGKLAPNWEGPYTVAEVPHPGAYVLQDAEGKRVPRVWNVNNLKKFYP